MFDKAVRSVEIDDESEAESEHEQEQEEIEKEVEMELEADEEETEQNAPQYVEADSGDDYDDDDFNVEEMVSKKVNYSPKINSFTKIYH